MFTEHGSKRHVFIVEERVLANGTGTAARIAVLAPSSGQPPFGALFGRTNNSETHDIRTNIRPEILRTSQKFEHMTSSDTYFVKCVSSRHVALVPWFPKG